MSNVLLGERLFNWTAAASVLFWAGMGLRGEWLAGTVSSARLAIAALHLAVAWLFLTRDPSKSNATSRQTALVFISFLGGALPFACAPPPHLWNLLAQILFCTGLGFATLSLLCLGRSFAVLPAVRQIVVRGPYRLVRHPAYAGELLAVAGCFAAYIAWLGTLAFFASIAMMVLRIHIEESLLMREPAYRAYAAQVRYRLIPYFW